MRLAALLLSISLGNAADRVSARVLEVIEPTIYLAQLPSDNNKYLIVLEAVRAHRSETIFRSLGREYAQRAMNPAGDVVLAIRSYWGTRGIYGEIYLHDGSALSELLLMEGLVWLSPGKADSSLERLQTRAQLGTRGVWRVNMQVHPNLWVRPGYCPSNRFLGVLETPAQRAFCEEFIEQTPAWLLPGSRSDGMPAMVTSVRLPRKQ